MSGFGGLVAVWRHVGRGGVTGSSGPRKRGAVIHGSVGDPKYGIKHLLARNLENLPPDDFAKIIDVLDASAEGKHVALAWIAKEKLRDALKLRAHVTGSTPCERQVRDKLYASYDWSAQND